MWQSETALRKLAIAYCLAALLLPTSASSAVDHAQQLKAYMQMAAESLGAPQRSALAQIKDDDRRNLAMTHYLRAGATIASRWSWTAAAIEDYQKSAAHAAALGEIDRIRLAFAANYPGYQLYANTQIRSLEEQLERWQTVRSIGAPATQLRNDALAHLAKYPSVLVSDAVRTWRSTPVFSCPTLYRASASSRI